jgi:hypothetical protein
VASGLGVADYDVGPDGRFVVVRPINAILDNRLAVALNWQEELKRVVPPK